ncbi:hypothetical protein [Synechococcus sp. UW179A]|nr:hypothetical protein [Synechococcus sp. UW179A]
MPLKSIAPRLCQLGRGSTVRIDQGASVTAGFVNHLYPPLGGLLIA